MPVRSWPLLSRRPCCFLCGNSPQQQRNCVPYYYLFETDYLLNVEKISVWKMVWNTSFKGANHPNYKKLQFLTCLYSCNHAYRPSLFTQDYLRYLQIFCSQQLRWVEFHLQWKITEPCKLFSWIYHRKSIKLAEVWLLPSSEVCFHKWFHFYMNMYLISPHNHYYFYFICNLA